MESSHIVKSFDEELGTIIELAQGGELAADAEL